MADQPNPEPGDDLLLLPNGMVRISLTDHPDVMLRRPTIGELRTLIEALHMVNDEATRKATALQTRGEGHRRIAQAKVDAIEKRVQAALAADPPDADQVEGLMDEKAQVMSDTSMTDRTEARALDAFLDRERIGWARQVFDLLTIGTATMPDPEAWPVWCQQPSFASMLTRHWREVPSRSGGS